MPSPLTEILRAARTRTVPPHVGFAHYLGALALFFLSLEVITGVLLMIYYRPGAGAAHYSTAIIMDEVRLGWLVRSMHRWGSDMLIALGLLHMVRVYFSRAYQTPRQFNWAIGICLLALVMTLAFTGNLLPWDQYAYWHTDSARRTTASIPVLGNLLLALFWGGWEIGEEVLLRFYALHVGILPWLAASLLSFHFVLIWRFGIKEPSRPRSGPTALPVPFFPDFLVNLLIAALLVGGLLFSIAVLCPPSLSAPADPISPASQALPPWYILPVSELLRYLHGGSATLTVIAFYLFLFLVPVIDSKPVQTVGKKVLHRVLGCLVIAVWIFLGVRGYLR